MWERRKVHDVTSLESGLSAYWMLHSPTTPRWRTVLMATERSRLYSEQQRRHDNVSKPLESVT